MKDIVLINNFCRNFSKEDNGRFMYLCKELSKSNRVEIITNDFSHSGKVHKQPLTEQLPFTVTFLHEPGYQKNISIKRFYSHNAWGKEVYKYLCERKKPDVIYCNVPSLTAALKASVYCRDNGVKFIIDIQDLWPEAFQMVLNIPVVSSALFYPFKCRADKIYRRADTICAVSQSYVDRALKVNRKCKSGHAVFIGTRVATFDEGAKEEPIIAKNDDELWLGYCGSLEASYDIPSVIDALYILQQQKKVLPRLIVMGGGSRREMFEAYAQQKGIPATFTGRLPYGQMCAVLSRCDMVVNPITKGSAASIINKHGDYAASGLPVVNTQDSIEYRKLVERYAMGFNCENGNAGDLAEKLAYLVEHKDERLQMGRNARKCAEEKFDRQNSYKELISTILE